MEQLTPQLMNRLVFAVIMHGLNDAQTTLALGVLSDALKHDNSQVRELAVVALADLSVSAAKRVTPLAAGLKDPNPRVRRRAARALGDQGVAAGNALTELIGGLADLDPSVRRDCAGAIGRLGPLGHPAAAAVVKLLRENDARTRAVAAVALKRIGKAAVPALLDGVRADAADLRGRCATLLAQIAPNNPQVAAVLQTVLTDDDAEVRARADEALQFVRTPPPVPLAV
ncbi:MAG: HEAT repeat domain-containing protein [Gemmataceae bacterium]